MLRWKQQFSILFVFFVYCTTFTFSYNGRVTFRPACLNNTIFVQIDCFTIVELVILTVDIFFIIHGLKMIRLIRNNLCSRISMFAETIHHETYSPFTKRNYPFCHKISLECCRMYISIYATLNGRHQRILIISSLI